MSKLEKQCSVTKTVAVPGSVSHFLQPPTENDENGPNYGLVTIGGLTTNLKYSWLANGARLQILNTETSQRVACWVWGNVLTRNKRAYIRCVEELNNSFGKNTPLFIIGVNYENGGGLLCVFDTRCNKILQTIQLDYKISCVRIVDSGCEYEPILGILKVFDGTIAVGVEGGDTYLIDLSRNSWLNNSDSNTGTSSKLFIRSCDNISLGTLETYKTRATQMGDHLTLKLNESIGLNFTLMTSKGEGALQLAKDQVYVSSLFYVPKLMSLFVGYNFGAWQIYNLLTMELEFTSSVYEECVPVSRFAFQEPSDDPKAFCYIWAVYSTDGDSEPASIPLATLYALSYETKENIEDYGVLYQRLTACALRFQMDLLPSTDNPDRRGGHCIALESYVCNPNIDNGDQRLTFCMIAWSSWPVGNNVPDVSMAIMDLDQWYKEQLPATLRNGGHETYMAQFNLTKLLKLNKDSDPILDIKIDFSSISPFATAQRLEEHYYPAALTFDCIAMQPSSYSYIKNNGLQRTILLSLEENGIEAFLRPDYFVQLCLQSGLQPMSTDLSPRVLPTAQSTLLSIALDYNLIRLLTTCAQQWATGAYASAGCTLGMFVEWASQRSELLQQKSNELCISLFDYSGIDLDCNAIRFLNQCAIQMNHLASIFKMICKTCADNLNEDGQKEVMDQLNALTMFAEHLQVLQWLLNIGLLPEAPDKLYQHTDPTKKLLVPYPAEKLATYYQERRSILNQKCGLSKSASVNNPCELLFIDGLIEMESGGKSIRREWSTVSGIENDPGLYPPRSIQALLRTYLINDVTIEIKHTILVYLFLDLAMFLDEEKYALVVKQLINFPSIVRLSQSRIKMTQAFWQLDHGYFEIGMGQLLDPLIGNTIEDEFKPWQHQTILRMLMANGQYKNAALYIQIRQPPFTDVNEICDAMNLLLSNDMLLAFKFQRKHRTIQNTKNIIKKFFEGCTQSDVIMNALKLTFTKEEEKVFLECLSHSQDKNTCDLEPLYYLLRSRWYEALEYDLNKTSAPKTGQENGKHKDFGQTILNSYTNTLTDVSREIFKAYQKESQTLRAQKTTNWINVEIPTPMSFHLNQSDSSRPLSISEKISKIREIWKPANNENPYEIESTPLLCNPKIPKIVQEIHAPITYPKVTYYNDGVSLKKRSADDTIDEEILEHQQPSKRRRLAVNKSNIETPLKRTATEKLLLTPIVKQRHSSPIANKSMNQTVTTPHSILKVRTNQSDCHRKYDRITPELDECSQSSDDEEIKMDVDSSQVSVKNRSIPEREHKQQLKRSTIVHFEGISPEPSSSPERIEQDLSASRESIDDSSPINSDTFLTPNTSIIEIEDEENEPNEVNEDDEVEVNEFNDVEVCSSPSPSPTPLILTQTIEEEVKTITRKLSNSTSNPYKSVKPRRSLQRAVLENSLVKSITPVIKSSKRSYNTNTSTPVKNAIASPSKTPTTPLNRTNKSQNSNFSFEYSFLKGNSSEMSESAIERVEKRLAEKYPETLSPINVEKDAPSSANSTPEEVRRHLSAEFADLFTSMTDSKFERVGKRLAEKEYPEFNIKDLEAVNHESKSDGCNNEESTNHSKVNLSNSDEFEDAADDESVLTSNIGSPSIETTGTGLDGTKQSTELPELSFLKNFDRSNISLNGSWAKRVEDKMTAGWSDSQIELLHWFTGRKVFPATEEVETQTLEPEAENVINNQDFKIEELHENADVEGMEEIKSGIIMEVAEDYNIVELDPNADVDGMEEIESGIVIEVPENVDQEDSEVENDLKTNLNLELDGVTSTSSDSDAKIVRSTWNHRRRTSTVRKSRVIDFHLSSDEEDKSSNEIISTNENPTSTIHAEIIHDISSDDSNTEGDDTSSDNANRKDDDTSSDNANSKNDDTSSENADSKVDHKSSEDASIVDVDDISSAESNISPLRLEDDSNDESSQSSSSSNTTDGSELSEENSNHTISHEVIETENQEIFEPTPEEEIIFSEAVPEEIFSDTGSESNVLNVNILTTSVDLHSEDDTKNESKTDLISEKEESLQVSMQTVESSSSTLKDIQSNILCSEAEKELSTETEESSSSTLKEIKNKSSISTSPEKSLVSMQIEESSSIVIEISSESSILFSPKEEPSASKQIEEPDSSTLKEVKNENILTLPEEQPMQIDESSSSTLKVEPKPLEIIENSRPKTRRASLSLNHNSNDPIVNNIRPKTRRNSLSIENNIEAKQEKPKSRRASSVLNDNPVTEKVEVPRQPTSKTNRNKLTPAEIKAARLKEIQDKLNIPKAFRRVVIPEEPQIITPDEHQDGKTLSKRGKRASSINNSIDESITNDLTPKNAKTIKSTHSETKSPSEKHIPIKRNVRASSEMKTKPENSISTRNLRAKSADNTINDNNSIKSARSTRSTRRTTQSQQITNLEKIPEQPNEAVSMEEYSTSRRLTRKQKNMLEKCKERSLIVAASVTTIDEESDSDIEERGPQLEEMDPIQLLDKKSFHGSPDSAEQKLLRSPASSIKTISSIGTDILGSRSQVEEEKVILTPKRRLRAASVDAVESNSTPKVRTRRLSGAASDITPRRSSRTLSHTSQTEELEDKESTPIKRNNTTLKRNKSKSPLTQEESKKPAKVATKRTSTNSRRSSVVQTDLNVIEEEDKKDDDYGPSPAKRGRPRKKTEDDVSKDIKENNSLKAVSRSTRSRR